MQRTRVPSATSSQSTTAQSPATSVGTGTNGGDASVNSKPRATNLALKFSDSEVRNTDMKPAILRDQVLAALQLQTNQQTKDGIQLTDTEKLHVATKTLLRGGVDQATLCHTI
jgi:NAD(P)H-hydrate repair Nnr-like enzyme with NAD(P)H-hydrate epimerase domain